MLILVFSDYHKYNMFYIMQAVKLCLKQNSGLDTSVVSTNSCRNVMPNVRLSSRRRLVSASLRR